MEQCPTCGARYTGKPVCHRCGTDLDRLKAICDQAAGHLENAAKAYESGDFRKMYTEAERARALHRTHRSEVLMACAALALKNWDKALSVWAGNGGMGG